MKEIKFRVWNDEAKVWILNVSSQPISWLFSHAKKYKFMQFTGLKDINDIEIYEGDIVRVGNYVYILEIDLLHGLFFICVEHLSLHSGNMHYSHFVKNVKIEVIGNIYENSELLNQETK